MQQNNNPIHSNNMPQSSPKRVVFTEEMRKTHTILVPNMLPIQFKLIIRILENYGYHIELLESQGPAIVEQGLKNVHNDTCYPALLVIGQLIDALESGKYDKSKVALLISQTGGGCRASNYIHLLRKALHKSGYDNIPVISINVSGLEENPGFKLTVPMYCQIMYGVLLGDLIMHLYHQSKPYELQPNTSDQAVDLCISEISEAFKNRGMIPYRMVSKLYDRVIDVFSKLSLSERNKPRVGIVGEIYVKFSPLGNNNLEDFLLTENAEVVMPGLLDFCLYCAYNGVEDRKLYGRSWKHASLSNIAYRFMLRKQQQIIDKLKNHPRFTPPAFFEDGRKAVADYIGLGCKMGEGWLLTAEMLELLHSGVNNIVCTQPFGCLPNHIAGKGMIRQLKEKNPGANIITIDYDPGASRINQENRIKLMLASAKA